MFRGRGMTAGRWSCNARLIGVEGHLAPTGTTNRARHHQTVPQMGRVDGMTDTASGSDQFLLSARSLWTEDLQVLGIFASEGAALEAANWERFAAGEIAPLTFLIEQWSGTERLRSMTSSPPFTSEEGAAFGWS